MTNVDTHAELMVALKRWADSRRFVPQEQFATNTQDLLKAYDAYLADDVARDRDAEIAGLRRKLQRSLPMLSHIQALGFPAAFVGQDGATPETVPWGSFDALFVGGSTEWKIGADARRLIAHARRQGKWVHMGRVNSLARLQLATDSDCDSADGTHLAYGPDNTLPEVLGWLRVVNHPALFSPMGGNCG